MIEVFWGGEPRVRSEVNFLTQLQADLQRRQISATILANFFTGSARQVDFLIITNNHVCHVELKGYSGVLVGGANGPWSTRKPDGALEEIDRQNPYMQAVDCKMAISDDMQAVADQDRRVPRPPVGRRFYTQIDSVVCVFPRLEAGSQVPGDFRARTLGYEDFVRFLAAPGSHPAWQPEHWAALIRRLSLTNATTGPNRRALAATAAGELVDTYSRRFNDFYASDLHELVPLPLMRDDTAVTPGELATILENTRHLQVVGPSGSGKSHQAKHTVLGLPKSRWLTIFVEAGMYDGRLSLLINRSVARFTTKSLNDLVQAAAITGQTVLLVIDGYNECPEPLQERLVGDLSAFCRQTNAATFTTTQTLVRVSDAMTGAIVRVGRLDEEGRKAVLTSYGTPEILELTEPFTTPYELSIAAECAAELERPVTRAALFSAFVRKRLSRSASPTATRKVLRRLALTMDDKLSTSLALDEAVLVAERSVAGRATPAGVIDDVFKSSITISQQGRFAFTHELLGRFLATEALALQHREPGELAQELRKPRHQDLLQLAIELETTTPTADGLLAGLADWLIYFRAIQGEAGRPALRAAQSAASRLLRDVTQSMADTTFTVRDQFTVSVTGGRELSEADRALLWAIGALVSYGQFFEEVAALLDATDVTSRRSRDLQAQTQGQRPTSSAMVSAVLIGGRPEPAIAANIILEAARLARHDSRLRSKSDKVRVTHERLLRLSDGVTRHNFGRLLLLCELLQSAHGLDAAALAVRMFRLCWASAAYHVRLEGLQMLQSFAAETSGQPVRDEIIRVLDECNTDNVMLSSQLVETLDSYGLLQAPDDADNVKARIITVLANSEADESRQWAYVIFSNQFEDVIAEPYVDAIAELTDSQRTELQTLAALGSPGYGFWNDLLLKELIKSGDRRALPAFERWATRLHTDNAMTQEVVSCYALGVEGWALFMDSPPKLREAHTDQQAAWECYGAIIFWMHRAKRSTVDVTERCRPPWRRLRNELLPAAGDPLYWLLHASRISFDNQPLVGRILRTFPDEVRPILEWSLAHQELLTSIFPPSIARERADYFIDMLGMVGNAETVELLQEYVDDPQCGRSAIQAIQRLTGGRG